MSNAFKKSLESIGRLAASTKSNPDEARQINKDSYGLSPDSLSFLDTLPDGITLHGSGGKVVWSNKFAAQLLETEAGQLTDFGFLQDINPQDKVTLLKLISDCQQGKSVAPMHIRRMSHCTKSGSQTHVLECRANLHSSSQQKAISDLVLLVMRDVSEQNAEQEIVNSRIDSAESANRLKSTFISNVSHELRTPLNAIIGFSEMLEGKTGLNFSDEARTEYAGLINQSANHLLNVLNDVLDMSKIEAGKFQILPEQFDLSELMHSTLKMMQPIAQKSSVRIKTNFAQELPVLTADKRAIRQITLNLVANAIKFSKQGGEVDVVLKRSARSMIIEIKDNGIGMDSETIEKLCSTFFQAEQSTERRYEGTGLGLSIVKGLVDLHGGSIHFDSELDAGTIARVELPLIQNRSKPVPSDPDRSLVFLEPNKTPANQPFCHPQQQQNRLVK